MRFEVGKVYEAYNCEISPVMIIRRAEKTVWVNNGFATWGMRIDHDEKGNEVAVDKSVPRKWRFAFTYSSALERKTV